MQFLLFVCGFILALVLIVPVFLLFYHRCISRARSTANAHSYQLEELGKLTGGLAHEIKNPLSTIKVNLKLINEDVESCGPESSRWLRKIGVVQKETERLEQILEDFLSYIGKTELQAESVDINELFEEMVDFYSPQARACGITMRVGLSQEPVICKIDSDMVKQVILNLLINAQQSISEHGEIIIRTGCKDDKAVIEISDTGSGIGPDKIDRIFEAYYTSRPGGS